MKLKLSNVSTSLLLGHQMFKKRSFSPFDFCLQASPRAFLLAFKLIYRNKYASK
jgi:hypothetical protein